MLIVAQCDLLLEQENNGVYEWMLGLPFSYDSSNNQGTTKTDEELWKVKNFYGTPFHHTTISIGNGYDIGSSCGAGNGKGQHYEYIDNPINSSF